MRGVGRQARGSWVSGFSLGAPGPIRALITIQASASLLSWRSLFTTQARVTPWSRKAHDSFFSLQGNAFYSRFPLDAFLTLVLFSVVGGSCGRDDGVGF